MAEYQVQVTMTIRADSPDEAMEGARRWLPGAHELPLSSSDGVTFAALHVLGAEVLP